MMMIMIPPMMISLRKLQGSVWKQVIPMILISAGVRLEAGNTAGVCLEAGDSDENDNCGGLFGRKGLMIDLCCKFRMSIYGSLIYEKHR
jgi:hypothetical protein